MARAGSSTRIGIAGLWLEPPAGPPPPPTAQLEGHRGDLGNANCPMCRLTNSHERLFQCNQHLLSDLRDLEEERDCLLEKFNQLEEQHRHTNSLVIDLKQRLAQQDLFAKQALQQVKALQEQLAEHEASGKRRHAELCAVRGSWVMALEEREKEKQSLEREKREQMELRRNEQELRRMSLSAEAALETSS